LKEQKVSRVIKPTVLAAIVAVASLVFAACGSKTTGSTSGGNGGAGGASDVAATVNGKNIMLSEVDSLLNQQMKAQQQQPQSLSQLELAAARLQVLDDLIKQEVLFQRADKEGLLPKDDEITQAINEQKQQNGMTEEQYQKMLKETNQTEQQIRDIARKQIAVKKLLDKVGSTVGVPNEKEVQDFYNNNKQQFVSARGVSLAAIVVDPADNGAQDDAKNDADAKQKVDVIYQRLKSGADFATVARERSEDQSNLRGGDIGFFTEDKLKQLGLPQDLIGKLFGQMQNGDVTPPQHLSDGRWYIFKLQEKRLQTENLTLDNADVRKNITDGLVNQRKQILNAAFLEVAMNEAKIDNKLAADIVSSPDKMSGLRPVPDMSAPPTASPAAAASPQATASPAASASPVASASPKKQ
jgi:peptidyl-prolyl cis-trans isomerase SurA